MSGTTITAAILSAVLALASSCEGEKKKGPEETEALRAAKIAHVAEGARAGAGRADELSLPGRDAGR